jgi:hypothetical protein
MDADIKYILDSVQEDIDTVSLFGRGADEDVQRARRGFEKLKAALAPAPVAVDFAQAVTCVQNYLEHDAKTGIVRTRTISVPRWVLEDLIQAATSQQAHDGEKHRNDLMDKIVSQQTEINALKAASQQAREWTVDSLLREVLAPEHMNTEYSAEVIKHLAARNVIKLKGE